MAVPKKRHTKSRRNRRRSHDALSPVHLIDCVSCGEKVRPHTVCENCGSYRGRRQAVDVLKDLEKQKRKEKEEELEEQREEAQAQAPDQPLDPEALSRRS